MKTYKSLVKFLIPFLILFSSFDHLSAQTYGSLSIVNGSSGIFKLVFTPSSSASGVQVMGNSLITVKAPTGGSWQPTAISSVNGGTWTVANSRTTSSGNDLISFTNTTTSSSLNFSNGQAVELFNFQVSGSCPTGDFTISPSSDQVLNVGGQVLDYSTAMFFSNSPHINIVSSVSGSVSCSATTTTSCVANKVRLIFRFPGECCFDRLIGAKIQGSNNGGSSWTDLYTFTQSGTGNWQEFSFSNTTAYSSLQFVSSSTGWGEVAELEFYNGTTKLTGTPGGSSSNYLLAFDGNTGTKWENGSVGTSNKIWLTLTGCGTVTCTPPAAPSINNPSTTSICTGQTISLTASGVSGTLSWYKDGAVIQGQTGTTLVVNSTGVYTAKNTLGDCVSAASGSVNITAGTNCGSATSCVANKVRLIFRFPGECCFERLIGAKIQGSNNGGNSWTDLYTFTQSGTGNWQEFSFSNTTAYSSLQFVSSSTGWGEVAELEFYNGTTKLTGTPGGSSSNYLLAFDGNTGTKWENGSVGTSNKIWLTLTGCGTVTCTPPAAPSINNPSSTSICAGQTISLTASGVSGTLSWYKDGAVIQGQTGTTLVVNTAGVYTAKNTLGDCISAASGSVNITAGTDCGSATSCVANKVRLIFRFPGECCFDRLIGAKIQGSNNGGNSWTDLYTFTQSGTGNWQEFSFSNTTAYSSLQFVSSSTGWGEVAELEFYNGTTKLTALREEVPVIIFWLLMEILVRNGRTEALGLVIRFG